MTYIIAEIGVNHNGSPELAREMVDMCIEAGVDAVKFQTYKAEEVMTDETPLADYMTEGSQAESFLDLARKLELSNSQTADLKAYTESKGGEFLSSPFDVPSTYFLAELGLTKLKIPSGETVNPFLLKAAAETGLELIISTGMCTMEEIHRSIEFLNQNNSGPISVLHCLTQYPAEYQYINLNAIQAMKKEFGLPIGFSDHTPGIHASVAAVALGAEIIEKHVTLDKSLPGPDQAASLEPDELKDLVRCIRDIESAMGDGQKRPMGPEIEIADIARKSLVFTNDLPADKILELKDLTAKRPGTGIAAFDFNYYVGKTLTNNVRKDQILTNDIIG